MPLNAMTRLLLPLSLSIGAGLLCADDGEVRFKTKAYTPRGTASDQVYRAPAYTPSDAQRSAGATLDTPRAGNAWHLFRPRDSGKAAQRLHDAPALDNEAYSQQKSIRVPSIRTAPGSIAERQPFEAADKKLSDAGYQAREPSRDKNPLLKPRQGIKEPE